MGFGACATEADDAQRGISQRQCRVNPKSMPQAREAPRWEKYRQCQSRDRLSSQHCFRCSWLFGHAPYTRGPLTVRVALAGTGFRSRPRPSAGRWPNNVWAYESAGIRSQPPDKRMKTPTVAPTNNKKHAVAWMK